MTRRGRVTSGTGGATLVGAAGLHGYWGRGAGADHGEKGDFAADLDAAHVDLHDGALAVGIAQRHVLVRRRGHEGPLDSPFPGGLAVRHPELVGQ